MVPFLFCSLYLVGVVHLAGLIYIPFWCGWNTGRDDCGGNATQQANRKWAANVVRNAEANISHAPAISISTPDEWNWPLDCRRGLSSNLACNDRLGGSCFAIAGAEPLQENEIANIGSALYEGK